MLLWEHTLGSAPFAPSGPNTSHAGAFPLTTATLFPAKSGLLTRLPGTCHPSCRLTQRPKLALTSAFKAL